eukprot:SAG31_NODE_19106_length_612_cov_0.775828_1_plen_42_part_01
MTDQTGLLSGLLLDLRYSVDTDRAPQVSASAVIEINANGRNL